MRIGIDLGGTKIEIIALDTEGQERHRERIATPGDYYGVIGAIRGLVEAAEARLGESGSVGIGMPGCISPATGLVKGANSVFLNGKPFDRDLADALGRPVRVTNDANCFALSEASDGAAAGKRVVFGVIMGTGCGGGVVVDGRVLEGPHAIAGEWGHTPLPWPSAVEVPGRRCWCGRYGCLETWISGTGLAQDCDGPGARDAVAVERRSEAGEERARAALARHADRLARGLAVIIDLIDPDAIVLGGGVSNMAHLYEAIPRLLPAYVFSDVVTTPVLRAKHGDSSGVRGAAWLWRPGEVP
ncbi:ROK family protein [Elioraea sp.]|uniref:ROK family protein n=1 Tax=Elioraea sp. TaxID=2185103 RepID=UPI003F6EBED9